MSATLTPTIVVGYDGSPAARAAVERGIDRVGSTGHLVVVIAHHVPGDYAGGTYYQALLNDSLDAANVLLAELEESCERLATVDWEPDVIQGRAGVVIALVADTRQADEIVIGTRGRGRVRAAAVGSVAMDVLHRATCPVLVIPERVVALSTGEHRADAALTT